MLMALPLAFISASGQPQPSKTLVVLPFKAYGVDSTSTQTVLALLRREFEQRDAYNVIQESYTPESECQDLECAVSAGRSVGADLVLYGHFSRLGTKVLWSFTLVDVERNAKEFSGDVTKQRIEDFQSSISGVAKSIETGVLETNSAGSSQILSISKDHRRDTIIFGIGVGQLFPVHGYIDRRYSDDDYNYNNVVVPDTIKRAFVLDSRVALKVSDNYTLDLLFGIRRGILLNIGASYDPLNSVVSPYVGGGLGYYIYIGEDSFDNNDPDFFTSGFQVMVKGGLWFFKTSILRAFANLDYTYIFNSRDDQAVTFTIGIASVIDDLGF